MWIAVSGAETRKAIAAWVAAVCGFSSLPVTAGEVSRAASVDDLAWMAGCWADAEEGQRTEECWLAPRGGMMLGVHRVGRRSHVLRQPGRKAADAVSIDRPRVAAGNLRESAARFPPAPRLSNRRDGRLAGASRGRGRRQDPRLRAGPEPVRAPVAARGESAPRPRARDFRQIKASNCNWWSLEIRERRAGGKDPLWARSDFRHGLLGVWI